VEDRQFGYITKFHPKKRKKPKKKKKNLFKKKKPNPAAMMMGFEPHDLHKSAQTIAVDVSDSVPAALR
jgi:hypothetical protein